MKKNFRLAGIVALSLAIVAPLITFAQFTGPVNTNGTVSNSAPISNLSQTTTSLASIVNWVVIIFWVLTVLFLVWAAILYLTGAGNEEKIKEAKSRVIYAIIAAAVALLSTGLSSIVTSLLGGGKS